MELIKELTRNEMRNIMAGHGGCHGYCCDNSGDCEYLGHCGSCDATTNEGCQSQLADVGMSCNSEDEYLAGLYTPGVA